MTAAVDLAGDVRAGLEERMEIATADVSDLSDGRLDVCETQFREYGGRTAVTGLIRTVLCCEDSVLVKRVIEEDGDGCVLVVDGGGSLRCALFGEKSARIAIANGWAGILVHGAVRDVAALTTMPLSVKALGTSPRRARQVGGGSIDVPVTFGGACFLPGGRLWSDRDGIVLGQPSEGHAVSGASRMSPTG